jgi:predicted esterase
MIERDDLGFVHRFVPPASPGAPTLLLLHGTGGDEDDLIQLGTLLLPGAAMLSPRGKVLEHGAPRWFRRLALGVFDEADLIRRTGELATFVTAAAAAYELDPKRIIAVGFSNGANIAASMFLLHPDVLRAGVLLRAMVPLEPTTLPDLSGVPIYIASGRFDPMIPSANAERLAAMLEEAGADVRLAWDDQGHNLAPDEVDAAKRWLAQRPELQPLAAS